MIDYSNMYKLDDVVLSSFCVNTNSIHSSDKFSIFNKYLNTIHNIEKLYTNSLEEYTMFVINAMLLNSLEINKNILEYEKYFYNVITGYASSNNISITPSTIAGIWVKIMDIYTRLITITSCPSVKQVILFNKLIGKTRFINLNKVNINYTWDVPITIYYVDGTIRNILILPFNKNHNIFSNFAVKSTIHSFPYSQKLSIIKLFRDSLDVQFLDVNLTHPLITYSKNYINSYYVDFSFANHSACNICPLVCNPDFLFKLSLPSNSHKKIKVKHIL